MRADTVDDRMKKNILLLNLPFERRIIRDYGCPHGAKADYLWPPVDLLVLGALLRNEASLAYIDAVAGNVPERSVVAAVREMQPDAIMTVLSSISLDSDLRALSEIRRVSPGTRIWATGDVVFFSEQELPGVDYLVRDLTNTRDILAAWRNHAGGGIIRRSTAPEFSIGRCPHELTRRYSYAMPYSLHKGITCILTNYGCPFSCTFCNSNKLGFKKRPVSEVIEELLYVQDLGFREVLIRDFTFNMSDAETLCNEMIRSRIRLKWSCWTSAALVNRDILRTMKDAGCYLIAYGAESGDAAVLQNARKPVDPEQVRRAVGLTREAGIEALTSFIVGLPGEDRSTTPAFIDAVDPDYLSLNILAPRLGTGLSNGSLPAATGDRTDSLLSPDDALVRERDRIERAFFLRPRRLLRFLLLSTKSPYRLMIFIRSGLGLLRRWIGPSRNGS